jgi:protoporphyrinogen oxidase
LDAAIEKAVAAYLREKNRTVVNVDAESLKRIRLEALDTQDKLIVPEEELYDLPEEPETALPTLPEGWDGLRTALTDTELNAVRLALKGGDVKAFADANGVMLEVLVDGINEKAADHIGDSLLELDGIYDEYKNKAAEMVK